MLPLYGMVQDRCNLAAGSFVGCQHTSVCTTDSDTLALITCLHGNCEAHVCGGSQRMLHVRVKKPLRSSARSVLTRAVSCPGKGAKCQHDHHLQDDDGGCRTQHLKTCKSSRAPFCVPSHEWKHAKHNGPCTAGAPMDTTHGNTPRKPGC